MNFLFFSVHWADVVAEKLIEKGNEHTLATAITPSGPIHVGNLREVITTEAIYRALKDKGAEAKLIFIADTFDPLRKVYPFLSKEYEKYVGMPISDIPCPCGKHKNYAEHFLEPFIETMDELGINAIIYRAHEIYKKGAYNETIKTALDKADEIREILNTISGRNLPSSWMPFNIKCKKCGKMNGEIYKYDYPYAYYKCKCGYEGKADLRIGGIGKLPWRVDWPARWKIFNVTFEAFGKDHAASGGSWETGREISRKVFGYSPPMPLVYEFIHLKGRGAMHGSTGLAVATDEIIKAISPEVLRFLFMKYEPYRHIEFDPGMELLDLADEYGRYERAYFGIEEGKIKEAKRVYELSQPYGIKGNAPSVISYRHLAIIAQIAKNFGEAKKIIERSGIAIRNEEKLKESYEKVIYWLKNYAPEEIKFEVKKEMPEIELSEKEKKFLILLNKKFEELDWNAEKIHSTIHETAKISGISSRKAFQCIYKIILGKKNGPRAGYFLQSLGKEFIIKRINDAINLNHKA